jgi:hypothetical protein
MKSQFGALLMMAMLSTCQMRPEQRVLQLHCHGDRIVDNQPATHSVRRIYRINTAASTIEDWNFETAKFVKWGTGETSITGQAATYIGETRPLDRRILVKREVRFDRSTSRIRDQVEASWGGTMAFEGKCEER